jgi:tetratricopeptide (TPR) repeat protein
MNRISLILPFVLLAGILSTAVGDYAAQRAYRAKRAKETAMAEQTVKELLLRDNLTADDYIRLALAHNELSQHAPALDAIAHVPDEVLAQKNQLDLKASCFHNVNFGADKGGWIRELAFIDRCLDKKYGNRGVWFMRKAKVVCQSSVAPAVPTIHNVIGHEAYIIDREQFEYAFELLQRAFDVEPNLLQLEGDEEIWGGGFPLLRDEPRFKDLVKKARNTPNKAVNGSRR